jgi:hypothetical protein
MDDEPSFAESVIQPINCAGELAVIMRHEYVGTEHILLGLIECAWGSIGFFSRSKTLEPKFAKRSTDLCDPALGQ